MNGDLDLSGSLGGLRIANPDDASPEMAKTVSFSDTPAPATSPTRSALIQNHSPSKPREDEARSVSLIEATSPPSPASKPLVSSSQSKDSYVGWKPQRQSQSIPTTYQDQQQAQFPQYPTMMPQNLHNHQTNAIRPVSAFYTQLPSTTNSANGVGPNGVVREGSYRKSDESGYPLDVPRRNSSRGTSEALQAGVLTRDGSHHDRSYKQSNQYSSGNGPVPARKMSRGIPHTRMSGSPGNGTTVLSASPYGLEGGPLASSEDWKDRGAAVGFQQDTDANGKPVSRYVKKGVKDFNFGQTLGEGSYSTVLAATDRQTLREYAIKVLDKRHIIKEKKVKYVNIEKDTLNRLTDHPGVVRLYYTFQDERSLYFVLDLASGGELLGVLKRMTSFDEECTRFYGAQILDAVEYMHGCGVIHRDLKPENVLLDDKMHVKITDFGTAKILNRPEGDSGTTSAVQSDPGLENTRASSFVGTAEYVSPELLTDKNACKASDLWAFGCIIYQLLAGRPPFKAGNEYQTFQKIVNLDYKFPPGFPEVARDLVERLLVLDPQRRLSIEHVKNHQFFDGITWGRGLWEQKAPRLKPYLSPPQPLIKLNGPPSSNDGYPLDLNPCQSTNATRLPPITSGSVAPRPHPRVITELPPPSQLDIEWSPVLTRNNERILKLGNLSVESKPKASGSPHSADGGGGGGGGGGSKLSRFFGGNGGKKRQRLVMVTSSGRIIMAAAGGDEKKSKSEISLLQPGTQFSSQTDAKGCVSWTVDTMDKRHTFEDVKSGNTSVSHSSKNHHGNGNGNGNGNVPPTAGDSNHHTGLSAQDWLDTLSRAKEIALSQSATTNGSSGYSYSAGDDAFNNVATAGLSNPSDTLDGTSEFASGGPEASGGEGLVLRGGEKGDRGNTRATLQKHHSDRGWGGDGDSMKMKNKRFSKRQSKGVLAAVF